MKNAIFTFVAALLLQSFIVPSTNSQTAFFTKPAPNTEFGDIHLHKQGQGVKIQWSMLTNAGVSSYAVQVTYEDPLDQYSNWTTKGTVTGNSKKMMMFTDNTDVFSGDAYYRIVATTAAGDVTSAYQWINIP
jgi:hypothetical protein